MGKHGETALPDGENKWADPVAGPPASSPAPNPHAIDMAFDSTDLPWDVGPSFCYWPLQILDRHHNQLHRTAQWTQVAQSENSSELGFSLFLAQDISSETSSPPVDTVAISATTASGCENHATESPFQQVGHGYYDEAECPSYPSQTSSGFTYEPPPLYGQHFIDLNDPRSWSPASTATLSPMLGNQRPPSPQKGLDSPPPSPPASSPKEWDCPECGKHFSERAFLRLVLLHGFLIIYYLSFFVVLVTCL